MNRLRILSCTLAILMGSVVCDRANAIIITLDSLTESGNFPAPGVYTTPGAGTSSWDHERTILVGAETAPTIPGATASVKVREAFAITSDIDGAATKDETITGGVTYRAVVKIKDDDPVNDPIYTLGFGFFRHGSYQSFDDDAQSKTTVAFGYSYSFQANNGQASGSASTSGFGGAGSFGATPPASVPGSPQFPRQGDQTFIFDITMTASTTTVHGAKAGGSEVALLAGLDTGLNPLIGGIQHYPQPNGSLDPSDDGFFFIVSATILSVPEPSTIALAGIGALGLLACRLQRRLSTQA